MQPVKKSKKSTIIRVLNCFKEGTLSQDLDIRKMVITPNGKYLITCAEVEEKETAKICVWSIETILEGLKKPKKQFLEVKSKQDKEYKFANWLLCVDAITTEIKGKKTWIVCAGSINGDVYIWSGDIDEIREDWNLPEKFFKNFSNENQNLGAIFDIRIKEDTENNTFNIYLISNFIDTISKEKTGNNFIKELCLSPSLGNEGIGFELKDSRQFTMENQWILAFDLYIGKKRKLLITGSNDNRIYKWDLDTGKKIEPEIGIHEDGVTCVKIFDEGNKLATGCLNNIIKVWDLNNNKVFELPGHTKEILSIDIQKDNECLISASKDNSIKIWDLDNKVLIRDINVVYIQDKDSPGLDFLRQIVISPKDKFIFAIKKDKILIIRNFGRVWHFCQQLEHIEKHDKKLYKTLYGANLKQIVDRKMENEESLRSIYKIIKNRLNHKKKANLKSQNLWELGTLFIPSFIKFEEDDDTLRTYVESVRTNYKSYWSSVKKMFYQVPKLSWKFRLFLTTDIEDDIEKANFIEITRSRQYKKSKIESDWEEDLPYIILEDRDQSQIRFLMVLDNVPTTFIPLLKAITLDIEDNRGDKDRLVFTDFKRSKENFVKMLVKPHKSTKKSIDNAELKDHLPKEFYYSSCIFKLDERYCTDFKNAEICIRKKSLEFTESLNPLESNKSKHITLFEAFRNNFHSPNTPKISIQIGKGIGAKVGKIMDIYLAKLVMLDFFFTIISIYILYWDILKEGYLKDIPGTVLFVLVNLVSFLIIFTLFMSLTKRRGSKRIKPKLKGPRYIMRGD